MQPLKRRSKCLLTFQVSLVVEWPLKVMERGDIGVARATQCAENRQHDQRSTCSQYVGVCKTECFLHHLTPIPAAHLKTAVFQKKRKLNRKEMHLRQLKAEAQQYIEEGEYEVRRGRKMLHGFSLSWNPTAVPLPHCSCSKKSIMT